AVAPIAEGDDDTALREAALRPRIIRQFLEHYENASLPQNSQIAKNLLTEMGVPPNAVDRSYDLIIDTARAMGFIREVKGKLLIDIDWNESLLEETPAGSELPPGEPAPPETAQAKVINTTGPVSLNNRVFITHGKNMAVVT